MGSTGPWTGDPDGVKEKEESRKPPVSSAQMGADSHHHTLPTWWTAHSQGGSQNKSPFLKFSSVRFFCHNKIQILGYMLTMY